MNPMQDPTGLSLTRRQFVRAAGAGAAGLTLIRPTWVEAQASGDTINAAFIGVGRQGKILLSHCLKFLPNVRFQAVCDIWPYAQTMGSRLCKAYKHEVNTYEDYREMLAAEKNLDAVIIATPDFVHAEMTNAALQAGLHVYCEKEMSNTLEAARSMVETAHSTGKLLQIGHQRRSNPFYIQALTLHRKDKFMGQITAMNGQWNQLKPLRPLAAGLLGPNVAVPEEVLKKYGYGSMAEFYEWRWFDKYAGGPMTDLGSHQVDIFIWMMGKPPKAVTAFGNADHAKWEARKYDAGYEPECFDHTMCIYEFNGEYGTVHAFYQVLLTSSNGGFHETFMGDLGSMRTSEIREKHAMLREKVADSMAWENEAEKFAEGDESVMKFDPLKSRKAQGQMSEEDVAKAQAELDKPAHLPHLENFFAAVGDKNVPLNCPADVGYETAVAVLKANESARAGGKRIELSADEFVVQGGATARKGA